MLVRLSDQGAPGPGLGGTASLKFKHHDSQADSVNATFKALTVTVALTVCVISEERPEKHMKLCVLEKDSQNALRVAK
jgi:hypothetical protein